MQHYHSGITRDDDDDDDGNNDKEQEWQTRDLGYALLYCQAGPARCTLGTKPSFTDY